MTKRNLVAILATIAVAGFVSCYLYTTNASYDGGLLPSMMSFLVTISISGGISLWTILIGGTKKIAKQKRWQISLSLLIPLTSAPFVGYDLVTSRFYSLQSIILSIFIVLLLPISYLAHKRGYKPAKKPVLIWAGVFITAYLLIFATVVTYVQVVQPITVEQATAIVNQAYSEDSYQFHSHLDFHQDNNPMGVYWFSQRYANLDGWVEVDLVTGSVSVV